MAQPKKKVLVVILMTTLLVSAVSAVSSLFPSLSVVNAQTETWGVIGRASQVPEIENIFWLFGNQSISYAQVLPDAVFNFESIQQYVGLVLWTGIGSTYNSSAVKEFAETKPVISNALDFCTSLYPSLAKATRTVRTATVEYVVDWGNFRKGDVVEMHNGTYSLVGVASQSVTDFANITVLSKFGTATATMFYMAGRTERSGFLVLDLSATTPNSHQAGNWHLFPAIAKASTMKAGQYARWMTDGLSWHSLEWINGWMTKFTALNSDIVEMKAIGTTVQGRPINALFIGKGTKYFLTDAAIHGVEKAGSHSLLRFSELLVDWYRTQTSWQHKLTQYKIVLIPVLNPDGYVAGTRYNANGKDLNRQFPPGASTTEPEAWALRQLMASYPPIQYVSLHTGGDLTPLYVYCTDPGGVYRNYVWWAVNEGSQIFEDLKHWGNVFDNVWVGAYNHIGSISLYGSLSASYAAYQHEAIALTVEHWSMPKANLHSQEFYISTLLAMLLHHDRSTTNVIHSNAFITRTIAQGQTGLTVYLDCTLITNMGKSVTRVRDFMKPGKPVRVYVDGVQETEGSIWTWDSLTSTVTISDATESIILEWNSPSSCDINHDGRVNMADVAIVARAFGTTPGSLDWNQQADLNQDATINMLDVTLVVSHFGEY